MCYNASASIELWSVNSAVNQAVVQSIAQCSKGSGVISIKSLPPEESAKSPTNRILTTLGFFSFIDAEIKALSVIEREQRAQDDEAKTGTRSIIVRITGGVIDTKHTAGIRVEKKQSRFEVSTATRKADES